jgi:hypothetical protein
MVAQESFFGIVKGGKIPETQSDINPLKLTRNQFTDGTQPMSATQAGSRAAALKHNVENALRLFVDKGQNLKRYGPATETDYEAKVRAYASSIGATINNTRTTPFVFTTIERR